MRWIYLTFIIVVLSAQARENPFEPTIAYMEEEQRILEVEQDYAYEFQEKADPQLEQIKKEVVERKPKKIVVKKEPVKTVDQESKIKNLIKSISAQLPPEDQPETEQVAKEVEQEKPEQVVLKQKEDLEKEIKKDIVEPAKQIVKAKPVPIEKVISKEVFNPTPFVKLINYEDKLEIYTDYKVYRKFNLKEVSKIVLDYHAKVNFYTKRIKPDSDNFNLIIVGNHKKEKYFRVVIQTKNDPALYKVTHQDNMVTIYKSE